MSDEFDLQKINNKREGRPLFSRLKVKPKFAIDKQTGRKVVIQRDKDFSPSKHTWAEGYGLGVDGYPERNVQVVVRKDATEEEKQEAVKGDDELRTRYEDLKERRAWLKPELKDEYAELRAMFS